VGKATASIFGRLSWLAVLATLAVGLAGYYYFMGDDATLPLRLVPHLQAVPLTLEQVAVGSASLPVPVSGFIVSLTHDLGGPFTQPLAAGLFLLLLAGALAGWVAVVSTLERTPFVVGMVPVIFLLMSLNLDLLGVFPADERYFLYLALLLIGGTAFGLHAFAEEMDLHWRGLIMLALVAGLSALLLGKSQLTPAETALQLAAYATPGGAVLVALLVLWVGLENIRALLWFNTQAEQPGSRFGLGPFLVASLLYLGLLLWLVWNEGPVPLFPGISLDPLVLLLPAVLTAGLGLRQRAPTYHEWVPYGAAARLYPLLLTAASGALAYALATANTPLLKAARDFTALALLMLGIAFWLYILINFMPLIQQRLRVYRVVFEPRRLPFYTVYILALGGLIAVQVRNSLPLLDQVSAGQYNHLGDLARQQSEASPDDLALALLAERYYAESGDVLARTNQHAQLGRAALYRFRQERYNEIHALSRTLRYQPSEKVALRLASLFNDPKDLFEGLDVLRKGLQAHPRSAALAGDLAQLFTQTALDDSVAYYLDKAEALAPKSYPSQTNQLAFLMKQNLLPAATRLAADFKPRPTEPALASNLTLLGLWQAGSKQTTAGQADFSQAQDLDEATFAQLYHEALVAARAASPALLPTLVRLNARPANAAYYEQLLFLQALTRHAVGQEQVARQLLAPLAAGTSATAGYYQYLLGLWQLKQQQYATAADQLALAATHGASAAPLARAYALALNGQADSARRQLRQVVAAPDSTLHPAAQALAQQLAAGSLAPAADRHLVGAAELSQARQAEQQNRKADARRYYQRLVQLAPFNEAAVLAAARYHTQQRDFSAAYEALNTGRNENPHSRALLKAYALAAADAGLTEYATETLVELKSLLPAAEYAALLATYEARRATRTAAAASFSTPTQ
jgi:hypothetical protein